MEMPDAEQGIGEVHTHIGYSPSAGSEGAGGPGGETGSSRLEPAARRAREVARRAGDLLARAGDSLEERTGLIGQARRNPLAAAGIAFAVGFLLAGRSDPTTPLGKAKRRLRAALMAGATSALAEEARGVVGGDGGVMGLVSGLMGGAEKPVRGRRRG